MSRFGTNILQEVREWEKMIDSRNGYQKKRNRRKWPEEEDGRRKRNEERGRKRTMAIYLEVEHTQVLILEEKLFNKSAMMWLSLNNGCMWIQNHV